MNYDVVLNANDIATLETEHAFTQGDYGNIQFSIRVKADGQYVADATRAYIVFALPNGMIVTGDDMSKTVATYIYVFQGNELQAPGKIVADVKLVYANGQISSNKFTFTCRPDPLADKNIPAGPYITALQKIVDDGQEKIDYLQALIDTLQEGVGETAVTRNDLQNNRDPVDAGLKAIDANMAQNLFFKSEVININTATTAGFAADARQLNPSIPGSLAAQLATTNSNLTYTNAETKFERNSTPADKVLFTKYGNIKRFSMWALNEWASPADAEVKICDLPAGYYPDNAFYKYMQFATGQIGYVSIRNNAIYITPSTPLVAGKEITLQDVYF